MIRDPPGPTDPTLPTDELLCAALCALAGTARLRVRLGGTSMTPFIRDGQPAEVGPAPARPRRGMVLVCRRPGGPLTIHRVVGVRWVGPAVLVCTKGDALGRDDGWWAPAGVLGQVVSLHRAGRKVPLDRGWRARLGWLIAVLSRYWILDIGFWIVDQGLRAFRI